MVDIVKMKVNKNEYKFQKGENPLKYIKIDFSNESHISILYKFYNELFIKEFTNQDEADSLQSIIDQAKKVYKSGEYKYYCIIALKEREIYGGIIGDYFGKCNCGVIEYIVVNPRKRYLHIGTNLINKLINNFNEDAKIYHKYLINHIDYCFFECENPNKVSSDIKNICISRNHFWNKNNAYKLNFDYYQTSLEEDKNAVECLDLCVIIINDKLKFQKKIKTNKVIEFLECNFKYSFNKNIDDNIELIKMKNDLKNIDKILLTKMI